MKAFVNLLICSLFLALPTVSIAMDGGGGGGFSNSLPGGSVGCGGLSLDNSNASVDNACDPVDASNCPSGTNSQAYYADCMYSTNGGGLCSHNTCTCIGSMENNIWAEFCAPATGTYDFEVGTISCSGGAESLQMVIWNTDGITWDDICDIENYSVFCDNGFTSNTTFSVDLAANTCYTIMFDGNAGADCSWDFNINCTYALGIKMLDYGTELSQNQNEATIYWEVIDEFDVSHYIIEKSTDGKVFEAIAEIPSHNAGEKPYKYEFTDYNPILGDNYYRLVEIEADGREFNYSHKVIRKTKAELELYPNPISNDLNINFGRKLSADAEISIYDVLGNLVYCKAIGQKCSNHKINMENQDKGMYFLFIKDGETLIQQKFYKE